jgi:hypothetical protein
VCEEGCYCEEKEMWMTRKLGPVCNCVCVGLNDFMRPKEGVLMACSGITDALLRACKLITPRTGVAGQ